MSGSYKEHKSCCVFGHGVNAKIYTFIELILNCYFVINLFNLLFLLGSIFS